MRTIICFGLTCLFSSTQAQTVEPRQPIGNVRLSFLVFPPFSPLLTVEVRTFGRLTAQLETNFVNIHGMNLKYFMTERMNGHYLFVGSAFLESDFLRKDKSVSYLPYAGYGYAHRFGKSDAWIFDSRLGVGRTLNADKNSVYPVLKTGIGHTF